LLKKEQACVPKGPSIHCDHAPSHETSCACSAGVHAALGGQGGAGGGPWQGAGRDTSASASRMAEKALSTSMMPLKEPLV
jgi:hypothetical protein